MPGNRQLFEKNLYFLSIKGGLWRFSVMRAAAPLFFFTKLRTRKAARRAARARALEREKPVHITTCIHPSTATVSRRCTCARILLLRFFPLSAHRASHRRGASSRNPRNRAFSGTRHGGASSSRFRAVAQEVLSSRFCISIQLGARHMPHTFNLEAQRGVTRDDSFLLLSRCACIRFSEIPFDTVFGVRIFARLRKRSIRDRGEISRGDYCLRHFPVAILIRRHRLDASCLFIDKL